MRYRKFLVIPLMSVAALAATTGLSIAAEVNLSSIPVCYDFSCKQRVAVSITEEEFSQAAGWLAEESATAKDERERIAKAVGWMEVLVGQRTPTHRDVAGNLPEGAEMPGQLDCIDESRNTTTYMKLFEKAGLLRHHKVVERAFRRAIFDVHWSGQLEELEGGERYVVDSWFQDNGKVPYIQPTAEWEDIPFFFTSYFDNGKQEDK